MPAKEFITFTIDDQLYGIDIHWVREINRQLDITTVPQAPAYVRGLVNLRGQIVTILDLKNRLGMGKTYISPTTHNIILNLENKLLTDGLQAGQEDVTSLSDKVALLVDNIGDVVTVDCDGIDPPPANVGQAEGQYIASVVKLEKQLMTILSVAKLLG